ncbi:MAG TPA: hypothetical protein VF118_06310 [Gemmatimonadaceae bacterium]
MIPALTSPYRDWGFIALGFSAGALIEIGLALLSDHGIGGAVLARWACAAAVGPLVVWSLLLDARIPHRVVLALGALALITYVSLRFR